MKLSRLAGLANREAELKHVNQLLSNDATNNQRCLIFRAQEATGVTFFARAIEHSSAEFIPLYFDSAAQSAGIAEQALATIRSRSIRARLQVAIAQQGLAQLLFGLVQRILPLLPKIGTQLVPTGASHLLGTLPEIRLSPFPSVPVEILAKVLQGRLWRPRTALFIVDNAQDNISGLRDLLDGLHSSLYNTARFVLFFVDRPGNRLTYEDWLARIASTGISSLEADFSKPTEHLVESYAYLKDIDLPTGTLTSIVTKGQGNIYSTIALLKEHLHSLPSMRPPEAEQIHGLEGYILSVLYVAQQALRFSDLKILASTSPLIYYPGDEAFYTSIARLRALALVELTERMEGEDRFLSLISTSAPELLLVTRDTPRLLAISGELYDYFRRVDQASTRHSESQTVRLLYRLAHRVEPECAGVYAQRIITAALKQGDLRLAREYIAAATRDLPQGIEDLYIRVAFFISVQDYQEAAAAFDRAEDVSWQNQRMLRLLHAIVVNRLRKHGEAVREIDALLAENPWVEERVVLISFKLISFLHEGLYDEALSLFESEAERLARAQGLPYLLRNGASVYLWGSNADHGRAYSMLRSALGQFKARRDWLGYYTTVSNLGTIHAYGDNHRDALAHFEDAYKSLAVFGTHHLEECGFNYSITLAHLGHYEEAMDRSLSMLQFFEPGSFPRLQLQCLVALLWTLEGRMEEALREISAAREDAVDCGLTEGKFYVFYNSFMLEKFWRANSEAGETSLYEAKRLGFSPGAPQLERLEEAIEGRLLRAVDLFSYHAFDYHQYWSQNPLEMLPLGSLATKAMGHYMHEQRRERDPKSRRA